MYGPRKVSGLKWPKRRTPLPETLGLWRDVLIGTFCGESRQYPRALGLVTCQVERGDVIGGGTETCNEILS